MCGPQLQGFLAALMMIGSLSKRFGDSAIQQTHIPTRPSAISRDIFLLV
jgi:hypothetical protein